MSTEEEVDKTMLDDMQKEFVSAILIAFHARQLASISAVLFAFSLSMW